MIEVDKADLVHLPQIGALVAGRSERFIVFCDDLSFEEGEAAYKALKAALDGSLAAVDDRLLVYATSNRRHLMPESMRENHDATMADDGEIHPGERVEEKISLSERFGLWLSFYPFSQDGYLDIVAHWLGHHGLDAAAIDAARLEALQFAQARGSRSGRVALQFARDWAGRLGLERGLAAGNGKGHGQGLDRPAPREVVDVAVGILTRADGAVLLADRPAGKPYAGYWEFPGGKVEPGETIAQALARELREELGIEVGASVPWMVYEHDYPHAYVRLHFSRIHDWRGTPRANEGQRLMYLRDGEAAPQPLLPAAGPALERCFDSDPPAAG
jgi:mutator protein MutT